MRWSEVTDGQFRLCWTETAGSAGQKPEREGVGSRIHFDWREEGLVCDEIATDLDG